MNTVALHIFLPPLTGLGLFSIIDPRLAPWATFYRRYAANQ
jgi:hypothetical protein